MWSRIDDDEEDELSCVAMQIGYGNLLHPPREHKRSISINQKEERERRERRKKEEASEKVVDGKEGLKLETHIFVFEKPKKNISLSFQKFTSIYDQRGVTNEDIDFCALTFFVVDLYGLTKRSLFDSTNIYGSKNEYIFFYTLTILASKKIEIYFYIHSFLLIQLVIISTSPD